MGVGERCFGGWHLDGRQAALSTLVAGPEDEEKEGPENRRNGQNSPPLAIHAHGLS